MVKLNKTKIEHQMEMGEQRQKIRLWSATSSANIKLNFFFAFLLQPYIHTQIN